MVPVANTITVLSGGTEDSAVLDTASLSAEIPDPPALIVPPVMFTTVLPAPKFDGVDTDAVAGRRSRRIERRDRSSELVDRDVAALSVVVGADAVAAGGVDGPAVVDHDFAVNIEHISAGMVVPPR